jgi:hypothetical protein
VSNNSGDLCQLHLTDRSRITRLKARNRGRKKVELIRERGNNDTSNIEDLSEPISPKYRATGLRLPGFARATQQAANISSRFVSVKSLTGYPFSPATLSSPTRLVSLASSMLSSRGSTNLRLLWNISRTSPTLIFPFFLI